MSLQLHKKPKNAKESRFFSHVFITFSFSAPMVDCVSWEQAWELLKKMAGNPECLQNIVVGYLQIVIACAIITFEDNFSFP